MRSSGFFKGSCDTCRPPCHSPLRKNGRTRGLAMDANCPYSGCGALRRSGGSPRRIAARSGLPPRVRPRRLVLRLTATLHRPCHKQASRHSNATQQLAQVHTGSQVCMLSTPPSPPLPLPLQAAPRSISALGAASPSSQVSAVTRPGSWQTWGWPSAARLRLETRVWACDTTYTVHRASSVLQSRHAKYPADNARRARQQQPAGPSSGSPRATCRRPQHHR